MDTERFDRICRILEGALELSGAERERFLAVQCGADAALRAEVESLLAHESFTGGLEPPEPEALRRALDSANPAPRIGAWRLEREIGAGGMGTVFLAWREAGGFRQRGALKLVRRDAGSAELLRRFARERQVLAALEHDHIARLLDGGATEDGTPYLVMEYVEGEQIDRWCDARRLPIAQRLALFLDVCSAVSCAHQNLVVHRDLKPANILVTADGVPKLLDFGIAKLVAPEDALQDATLTQERLLTPAYASPEQLRGAQITTRSDVYSLGVILYELLCGRKPYQPAGQSMADLERAVLHDEPPRPSAAAQPNDETASRRATTSQRLRRQLEGDLDVIVLTALRKEPERRYASVEQLAGDLRRHLEGLPVQARPDTLRYRAVKYVSRNRLAVGAAAAIFGALVVGLAVSTAMYLKVRDANALAGRRLKDAQDAELMQRTQRERADARAAEVQTLATRFIFDVHDAIATLPKSLAARELIVTTAIEYLDRLLKDEGADLALKRDVARGYLRVAALQFGGALASLGRSSDAMVSLQRASALIDELRAADPGNEGDERMRYQVLEALAPCLENAQRAPEAVAAALEADAICVRLLERHPDDIQVAQARLQIRGSWSSALSAMGEHERSAAIGQATVAFAEDFAQAHPQATELDMYRAGAWELFAMNARDTGDLELAQQRLEKSLAILEPRTRAAPEDVRIAGTYGSCLLSLGRIQIIARRNPEAEASLRRANEVLERALAADPRNANLLQTLGIAQADLGALLGARGASEEALAAARAGLATADRLLSIDPEDAERVRSRAIAALNVAVTLLQQRRVDEGLLLAREAIASLRELGSSLTASVEVEQSLMDAQYAVALYLVRYVRETEAPAAQELEHLREARALLADARATFAALKARGALDAPHLPLEANMESWANGCDELVRAAEAEVAAAETH